MSGPATLYQAGVHGSRPANGSGCVLYSCTTHNLVYRDDGTSWTTFMSLVAASGVIATDTIWDAKGDLAAGTGADTAAKRTVGADDTILMADSAQTTGLKWVASQTPSTQAFSDAAAEGTADTFARGDHKHAMPASPSGIDNCQVVARTAGNVTQTTATWTDFTGMTVTLTTGARRCRVLVNFIYGTGGGGNNMIDVDIDGTRVGGTLGFWSIFAGGAITSQPADFSFLTPVLTAGSHTLKLQGQTSNPQAFTMFANSGNPAFFQVEETNLTT